MKLLVTVLLLPPGIILVLLALALWWWRKHHWRAFGCLVAAFVVGWALSSNVTARMLSAGLVGMIDGPAPQQQLADMDGIVVLTGGMIYVGDIGWLPHEESFRRVAVAYELQQRIGSRVPVLISGGRTAGLQYPSEARVVQQMFDRHRAQITPTELEEASTNTYESALQTAALLQKRRAEEVFLITSEIHMVRALAAYRGRGLDPVPFPAMMVPRGPLKFTDFLPTMSGLHLTTRALYEYLGLARYLMQGYISWDDIFYK
jgi:uncharacterized SAM-binding protein YcdF (DUF218 family)